MRRSGLRLNLRPEDRHRPTGMGSHIKSRADVGGRRGETPQPSMPPVACQALRLFLRPRLFLIITEKSGNARGSPRPCQKSRAGSGGKGQLGIRCWGSPPRGKPGGSPPPLRLFANALRVQGESATTPSTDCADCMIPEDPLCTEPQKDDEPGAWRSSTQSTPFVPPSRVHSVGWVERSETHHRTGAGTEKFRRLDHHCGTDPQVRLPRPAQWRMDSQEQHIPAGQRPTRTYSKSAAGCADLGAHP